MFSDRIVADMIKSIEKLLNAYYLEHRPIEYAEESTVGVNEVVAKAVLAYEKIRNIVDYRDEHLLRKSAINRICKRRFSEVLRGAQVGESIIKELIRAGYIENYALPETKINQVNKAFNKTANLWLSVKDSFNFSEQNKMKNWLLGLVSVEIEDILIPTEFKQSLILATYSIARLQTEIKDDSMSKDEKDLQLYVGCQRALFKSDNDMIAYSLLKLYYPNWIKNPSPEVFEELKIDISKIKNMIDYQVYHPLARKIQKYCKPFSVYFYIIKDLIEENPDKAEQMLNDAKQTKIHLKIIIAKKKKSIKSRLNKSIFRAIIYIFLTKMLIALAIEVPFEYFVLGELKYVPLLLNLFVPIVILFFIGKTIIVSSAKNSEKILEQTMNIIFGRTERMKKRIIKPARNWGAIKHLVFALFYLFTYIITFGGLIWLLIQLEFSIVSATIFIVFLSIVSFFGYRLRQQAKEMHVMKIKGGFLSGLFEFFFMPVIKVGQWISVKFSKINIFIFILDFIIAAPFNVIIEVIDDWFAFLKEKKEEIY